MGNGGNNICCPKRNDSSCRYETLEKPLSKWYIFKWLDHFFEQPFGVNLKEVYREKHNYILSPLHEYRYEIADIFSREYGMPTSKAVTYLNPYIEKYMHIKPDIINHIRNRCHHIFTRYEYVLGIHYRGTDMRVEHDGHFISKNENEYVKQVGQHIEHLSTKKLLCLLHQMKCL